jgi:hypothetical protein
MRQIPNNVRDTDEIHGITNRVFSLHKRGLSAILEVVAAVGLYEVVANRREYLESRSTYAKVDA